MKDSNIRKLQKVDLEIVKEVVSICETNKLKYYIIGGTLLGAIRHNGFIPWDDDIDIGMPRNDYERFLKIAPTILSKHLDIVNFRTDPSYQYFITRVRDTETKVVEIRIGNSSKYTNASIDIFPLDGSPNNILLRKIYYLRIMTLRALISLCYKDSIDKDRKRNVIERLFISIMIRIPFNNILNPNKLKNRIDNMMKKYQVQNSYVIGCLMGAYRTKEMVPKRIYGEGAYYKFEDIELRGPEFAKEFLRMIYGNYMELPSQEEKKVHFKIIEIKGERVTD